MQTQIKSYPQKGVLWSGELEVVSMGQLLIIDTNSYTVMRSYVQLGTGTPTQLVYARRGGGHDVQSVPRPPKR